MKKLDADAVEAWKFAPVLSLSLKTLHNPRWRQVREIAMAESLWNCVSLQRNKKSSHKFDLTFVGVRSWIHYITFWLLKGKILNGNVRKSRTNLNTKIKGNNKHRKGRNNRVPNVKEREAATQKNEIWRQHPRPVWPISQRPVRKASGTKERQEREQAVNDHLPAEFRAFSQFFFW